MNKRAGRTCRNVAELSSTVIFVVIRQVGYHSYAMASEIHWMTNGAALPNPGAADESQDVPHHHVVERVRL